MQATVENRIPKRPGNLLLPSDAFQPGKSRANGSDFELARGDFVDAYLTAFEASLEQSLDFIGGHGLS